jgi:hypothetical protein
MTAGSTSWAIGTKPLAGVQCSGIREPEVGILAVKNWGLSDL